MNAISNDVIRPYWLGYFREFVRGQVHDQLLEAFSAWKAKGNNRAGMAKKLDRRPEQITRWLSAPSNLEIDSITDISLAMGCVPRLTLEPIDQLLQSNGPPAVDVESAEEPKPTEEAPFVQRPNTGASQPAIFVAA